MRSLIDRQHDRIGVCNFGLDIVGILAGIGTAAGVSASAAGGAAAPIAGAAIAAAGAASLAGSGLSIAQATKGAPKPPGISAEERAAEQARRRGILSKQTGRQSTITTGSVGAPGSSLGRSVLGAGGGTA